MRLIVPDVGASLHDARIWRVLLGQPSVVGVIRRVYRNMGQAQRPVPTRWGIHVVNGGRGQ